MMTAEQLKGSILQLAMQGKLVEQKIEEGTGEELYKEIQAEKKRLIKAGKIKPGKNKNSALNSENLMDINIPGTWKLVTLQDVAYVTGGFAFKSSAYTEKGVRVIRISDFNEQGFVNTKIVRHPYDDSLSLFRLEEKNILLCMTGGTVGKSYFVTKIEEPMMTNQRVATIKAIDPILPEYLNMVILSPATQKVILNSKNSTNDNISMDTINGFIVPLPPFAEQKRIVAKIEELMPFVEQYATASTKLNTLNTSFPEMMKKSILQEAVQGKLVPQDPNDEPASLLLKKIAEEKKRLIKEGKIKKQKPLPGITEDEIPFEIPESWEWARIGEIALLNPKNDLDDSLETSFIPMTLVDDKFSNHHTSEKRKWGEIKKGFSHFAEGDIGVAKITPCFQNRKSCVFKNLINGYGAGTTELSIVRPLQAYCSQEYLLCIFKSELFISNGVKSFTGTAGQQRIHKDYLRQFVMPVPPFEEQKRIVAKVKELMMLVDGLVQ